MAIEKAQKFVIKSFLLSTIMLCRVFSTDFTIHERPDVTTYKTVKTYLEPFKQMCEKYDSDELIFTAEPTSPGKQAIEQLLNLSLIPATLYGGVPGFYIQKFTDKPNRNHWAERDGATIEIASVFGTWAGLLGTLDTFTKNIPEGRVSAHCVVTCNEAVQFIYEDSKIRRLIIHGGIAISIVPEEYTAWYAGLSHWGARENINKFSFGLGAINLTNDFGAKREYHPYSSKHQITSISSILKYLKGKHNISNQNIIATADAKPNRADPLPQFPWDQIANDGMGMWITPEEVREQIAQTTQPSIQESLKALGYGYTDTDLDRVTNAFKAHFVKLITKKHTETVVAAALAKKYAATE